MFLGFSKNFELAEVRSWEVAKEVSDFFIRPIPITALIFMAGSAVYRVCIQPWSPSSLSGWPP